MDFKEYYLTAKKEGMSNMLFDLFYKGMNKFFPFKILQAMVYTPAEIEPDVRLDENFQFKLLPAGDLKSYINEELQLSEAFLLEAGKKEDYCLAVFDQEKLVSYGWYSKYPTNISRELQLTFNNQYMYQYKGYTVKEYRGKRLHAIGKMMAMNEFAKLGFKGLISYVEKNNFSSLKSNYRMGYDDIGMLMMVKLNGRYFFYKDKKCEKFEFNVKQLEA